MANSIFEIFMSPLYQYENTKFFRILSILYKLLHFLFQLDFGFTKYKYNKVKIIHKIITLCQSIAISGCLLYSAEQLENDCFSIFQYLSYVIFLLFHNNEITFHNFLCDLKTVDTNLGVGSDEYFYEIKMMIVMFVFFVIKLSSLIRQSYYLDNIYFIRHSFMLSICFCIDLVCISNTFFYYAAMCRMTKLINILTSTTSDFQSIQKIYKSIVNTVEKYKPSFDFVFLTTLFHIVIQAMLLVYRTVDILLEQNIPILSLELCIDLGLAALILTLVFGTPLCAGMLTVQAEKIKKILLDKQITTQDKSEAYEIERFIRYVECRGCRYRVYRVIPLDADLLGMVLGFCATYLIVIIQFTHFNNTT